MGPTGGREGVQVSVRMMSRTGTVYDVPEEQVAAAEAKGWSRGEGPKRRVTQDSGPALSQRETNAAMGREIATQGINAAATLGPMLIPGAGLAPAALRLGAGFGLGTGADMANRRILGAPQSLPHSMLSGAWNAGWQAPFELLGVAAPGMAEHMSGGSLKPSRSQQRVAASVEARQARAAGQDIKAEPDYNRLGKQMLSSENRVSVGAKGRRKIEGLNAASKQSAEEILDLAGQQGWNVTAPQLARSPQVKEVLASLRMDTAPKGSLNAAHDILREFMETRATKGTPKRMSQVVDAQGNPIVIPGTPKVPYKLDPNTLKPQQKVWRQESSPLIKARNQGVANETRTAVKARIDDALARAAKERFDAIKLRVADTENAGKTVGIKDVNARMERRIPLAEAMRSYEEQPPMSFVDHALRLSGGHLGPSVEGKLALMLSDPRFQPFMRVAPRVSGVGLTELLHLLQGQRSQPDATRTQ